MKKFNCAIVLALFMVAGYSQDCGIRFILFNNDSIVVALPFLQYAIEDAGNKSKIMVEYPPTFNTRKTGYINWERQIRVKDSINYIYEKTGKNFVEFHISGTRYLVNKAWIESIEPLSGGDHALIAGRFKGKKFTSDETYEYIISQLFECPYLSPGDSLEVCADNGLNVDIGNGCVEIGGTLYKNTNVILAENRMNFIGRRSGGGVRMTDNLDDYLIGTGTASNTDDAYARFYRDIDGNGRILLAGYTVLIGVPAGNGYFLQNERPGSTPETYPSGTAWFPMWTKSGSGTGTTASWYRLPTKRVGVFTGTTDASGNVQVLPGTMPDDSYMLRLVPVSTTAYAFSVHDITSVGFKINTPFGAGTSVTFKYDLEDY